MKISFHVSNKDKAQAAYKTLRAQYHDCVPDEADVVVVLGGDGMMLRALHEYAQRDVPLYGLNLGTLGFLLNEYRAEGLVERIEAANEFVIHPLRMHVTDIRGAEHTEIAFNEVSILRETHNSAKIKVSVNDEARIDELVCDGIMVATPVGSTAYNLSAGGPIVPLDANVLPITAISPFRPRRWAGALVRNSSEITLDIHTPEERPVSATADSKEVRDVASVKIREARSVSKTILFDPDNPLEEKIFQEQFSPKG